MWFIQPELWLLLLTAVSISFLHTVSGPDHYLPFIALSKARRWTIKKTICWTIVCGVGHVWSSVLLALGGAAIGWSLSSLTSIESMRGGVAGWMLAGFGLVYTVYGLYQVKKNKPHKHFEWQEDGEIYVYEHKHDTIYLPKEKHKVTPWVMFLIFLLGPCEPMIPLLYFPAVKNSGFGLALLIGVYTVFTLATMLGMVLFGLYGLRFFRIQKLEKYLYALGGFSVFMCGLGIVWLDW
jgi:hypothetical protein